TTQHHFSNPFTFPNIFSHKTTLSTINHPLSPLLNRPFLSQNQPNKLMQHIMTRFLTDPQVAPTLSILPHTAQTPQQITRFLKPIPQNAPP
ncbi:hypothetical protein, partial [Bacillus sp. WP8]|uniref:hypothetical protein n=1 Tax=Bacillus sp. WP8 TaxID=756828 RepID=UPI001C92D4F0